MRNVQLNLNGFRPVCGIESHNPMFTKLLQDKMFIDEDLIIAFFYAKHCLQLVQNKIITTFCTFAYDFFFLLFFFIFSKEEQ